LFVAAVGDHVQAPTGYVENELLVRMEFAPAAIVLLLRPRWCSGVRADAAAGGAGLDRVVREPAMKLGAIEVG